MVGELRGNALSDAGFAEAEIDDAAANPGDETGGVGKVDLLSSSVSPCQAVKQGVGRHHVQTS